MVRTVIRSPLFIKQVKHLDKFLIEKIKNQIRKILENPFIGKPLRYKRGERALYIHTFRLIYAVRGEAIILLKFDHRKRVYR